MKSSWQELMALTAGKDFAVERVRLVSTDVAIEGEFELPPLASLATEDQVFVASFVKCHGSIKQMEQLFGVSYPTIKNRLNRIGERLQFVHIEPVSDREDVLQRLERGELTLAEALNLLESEKPDGTE